MRWSMKPKSDTASAAELPALEITPSMEQRLQTLVGLLAARPELLAKMEVIVGLASDTGVEGPLDRADEVEGRVLEAVRQLGNQTMRQWAEAAQVRTVAACQKEPPKATIKKKAR